MAEKEEAEDPGFGKAFQTGFTRLINKDGSFNVNVEGYRYSLRDAYVLLINMKWFPFLLVLISGYLIFNVLFAVIYLLVGIDQLSIVGTKPDLWKEFLDAFFFSAQTFTTVGYGSLSPKGTGASTVAALEAMTGLFMFSVATGLIYGRFSKPQAKLIFSDEVLLAPYRNGINALMFRVSNRRTNVLMEINANVMLAKAEKSVNEFKMRYFRLKLETNFLHFLPLSWTVVHPIDDESPLHGMSPDEIKQLSGELMIMIKAFDEGFGQHIHRRHSYSIANELKVGAKFKRNFNPNAEGSIDLHLDDINLCEKAELYSVNQG